MSSLGPLPYEKQGEVFRASRVVVGGHPGGGMDYYLSDREFIAAASGTPFVEFWTPRIHAIFKEDKNWYLYRNNLEMIRKVDRILNDSKGLFQKLAQETEVYARSSHSNYHRLKEMVQIAQDFRLAKAYQKKYEPRLNFFLPEVNWGTEKRFALRGWAHDRSIAS